MESRKRTSSSKARIKKTVTQIDAPPSREKLIADLMKNRLYDSIEVSIFLGVSQQSLRRAISAGRIKTVRLGRFLRIPAEEIERLLKGETILLSVQEAADLLKISCSTIRTLIKAKKIEAFRLADFGPFKIPQSEIKRIAREGVTK